MLIPNTKGTPFEVMYPDTYKCPTCGYRDDGPETGISLHFNKQLNPDRKDITRLCPACLFKLIAEKVPRMEKEEKIE